MGSAGTRRGRGIRIATAIGLVAAALGIVVHVLDLWGHLWGTPRYTGPIALTYPANAGFVAFLTDNAGRTVEIDATVDVGASVLGHRLVAERCAPAPDFYFGDEGISGGYIANREMPIPIRTKPGKDAYDIESPEEFDCARYWLRIDTSRGRYDTSHGGTGIADVFLRGAYRLERFVRPGASLLFVLEEM
jgi:hypothetical protein